MNYSPDDKIEQWYDTVIVAPQTAAHPPLLDDRDSAKTMLDDIQSLLRWQMRLLVGATAILLTALARGFGWI